MQELCRLQPDIVSFQEVWSEKHAQFIRKTAKHQGLVYEYGSPSTGGMLLLSKFPIQEKEFIPFRNTGSPSHFSSGEFLANKGFIRAKICTPGGCINVISLHLVANYSESANIETVGKQEKRPHNGQTADVDVYKGVRAAQLVEMLEHDIIPNSSSTLIGYDSNALGEFPWTQERGSQRIMPAHGTTEPTILLGDFNQEPHESIMQAFLTLSGLVDASAIATPSAPEAFGSLVDETSHGHGISYEQSVRIAKNAYNAALPSERGKFHPSSATIHAVYSPFSSRKM